MRGTDAIVFMLLIGYVVYTTMRGNLRRWLEVVGLKPEVTSNSIATGSILRGQK